MIDRQELLESARLQRERAQKAQYESMILRDWATEVREDCRALQRARREERSRRGVLIPECSELA